MYNFIKSIKGLYQVLYKLLSEIVVIDEEMGVTTNLYNLPKTKKEWDRLFSYICNKL